MGRKNRRIRECYISTMVCPKCGNVTFVPRKPRQEREKYHRKKLWCPYCKTERNFIEYQDRVAYRNGLGEAI
jgi:ribosomal protein S27AE